MTDGIVAETITIVFSATGLTNATSASVVVGPAAADRLMFSTQPGEFICVSRRRGGNGS